MERNYGDDGDDDEDDGDETREKVRLILFPLVFVCFRNDRHFHRRRVILSSSFHIWENGRMPTAQEGIVLK